MRSATPSPASAHVDRARAAFSGSFSVAMTRPSPPRSLIVCCTASERYIVLTPKLVPAYPSIRGGTFIPSRAHLNDVSRTRGQTSLIHEPALVLIKRDILVLHIVIESDLFHFCPVDCVFLLGRYSVQAVEVAEKTGWGADWTLVDDALFRLLGWLRIEAHRVPMGAKRAISWAVNSCCVHSP